MNQTTQEAAQNYALSQDVNRNEELLCTRAFKAGAEWAELKWIPVTERLPDGKGVYGSCVLALIGKHVCICNYTTGSQITVDDEDDNETLMSDEETGESYLPEGWYELEEQTAGQYDECWVKRSPSHWCPIPNSLLNFKP